MWPAVSWRCGTRDSRFLAGLRQRQVNLVAAIAQRLQIATQLAAAGAVDVIDADLQATVDHRQTLLVVATGVAP